MIQHVRPFNATFNPTRLPAGIDDEDSSAWDETEDDEQAGIAEFDTSLDYLLKYALKTQSSRPDSTSAWQQLSRRVQGPFGGAALALEAPDFSSIEAELLSSGGRVQQA